MRGFSLLRGVRAIARVLWRSKQLDADMQAEMRFHVQMEAERLMRVEGLGPEEARRQAYVGFGGVEKYKEEGREARGLYWLDGVSLDARLGVRMLVKHRWLTLVGGFAMTVAIAIGAMAFEVIGDLLNPALPFPDGQRVVAVKYVATKAGRADDRVLHAFSAWRDRVTTLEHLGAFRNAQHNLVAPNAPPDPIEVAEITASAFDIAQTPPMLGRYLLQSDEAADAPPVVVIGHDAWRVRFHSDPQIVGRDIQLGGTLHSIVGVMPAGFGFPVDHQFWMPLRLEPSRYAAWQGPDVHLFARLKRGATLEQAEAELASTGRSVADVHPDGPDQVRPVVLPFTREHSDLTDPTLVRLLRAAQLLVGALSFVVAVNLAILLYARTITRLGEIAVRTALGASRGRILSQLFVEALTLTVLGAVAGLVVAGLVLQQVQAMAHANGGFPFWVHYELSAGSVLYGLALAVIAAVIMGVLPGLKATGKRLSANLQVLNGRAAARLGSLWTTLIVAQVAVAAALLPAAAYVSWHVVETELTGPTIAVEHFVVANMNVGDQAAADRQHVRNRLLALMARLREEPGVTAVTFSSAVPGFGPDRRIEFQDEVAATRRSHAGGCGVPDRCRPAQDLRRADPGRTRFRCPRHRLVHRGHREPHVRVGCARRSRARGARVPLPLCHADGLVRNRRCRGRLSRFPPIAGLPDGADDVPTGRTWRFPPRHRVDAVRRPNSRGDLGAPAGSWRSGRSGAPVAARGSAVGLLRRAPLRLADDRLGVGHHHDQRPSALRGRHARADVVHHRAADTRNRHPFSARRPAAPVADGPLRTRDAAARNRPPGRLARVGGGVCGRRIGVRPAAAMLLTVATVMALVASFAALGPARRSLRLPAVEALRVEG